ncbi:MAG TPA: PKD domain-containing protein, partial [Bacteroidia bacterium]|nr:PKD domain-containing protein [Bacteroidia bacterium]
MMKKIYFLSALSLLFLAGAFSQNNKEALHDDGFNSPQHYQLIAEQHRLVRTYLGTDAFNKIFIEVLKKANVTEKDQKPFYKMLKEKYSLKDKYTIIAKINSGEISQSNIEKYLSDIKPTEYASYYEGAYLKGKSTLLENAPKITPVSDAEMQSWLSARLGANVVTSAACGNVDFNNGNFGGWAGHYTTYNCTSPTPNTRNINSLNYTAMNTTTDQHGLCSAGADPSVVTAVLPTVSPFAGGAPVSCRLGDVLDGCGAADLQYSFVVNANNTNFTYSYAVILYDGHPATDAPKVMISMKDLTTGLPINCATYTMDATGGAGGANGYLAADPLNTLMYYKPWSQVYIPLLAYVGHNVQVNLITSDCNGGAHRGYMYVDFTCSPLQLLSSTPMVCGGSTAVLTAPPGASSYSWATVGGSGTIIGSTTNQTVTIGSAGHYQVTLGSFGSGCTLVIDTIIPGGPTGPIANFTDAPGCFSVPVPFTDQTNPNGGGPVTGWSWNFGDGGTSTVQNPNHTYAAAGTYTVTLTSTNGGCVSTYTAAVTVTAGVVPSFTGPPVCLGAPTTITNTTAGAATYTWTLGNGTTSNSATPAVTYTAAGSYAVTLSVTTGGGCTGTVTNTVVVNPPPTVTATGNTICNGAGPVNITAAGATTYTWNTGATGATLSQNPAVTTNYTVTGTNANGCVNTATTTINVISNPTITVVPTSICAGSTGTLTISGATTYTWTGPSIVGATTGSVVTANPGATSTYTVNGTVGTCTATTTGVLTVNPMPVPAFTAPPVCIGAPTTITNTTTGAATYTWTLGNGTTSNSATPAVTYTAAGPYAVTLSVTSGSGCTGTITNTIVVNPLPTVTATGNTICNGAGPVNITAGGASTYTWNTGSTGATLSQNPGATTNYTVTGTDANGCVNTATTTINVINNPTVSITPTSICVGSTGTLTVSGATTYTWTGSSIVGATTGSLVTANPGATST